MDKKVDFIKLLKHTYPILHHDINYFALLVYHVTEKCRFSPRLEISTEKPGSKAGLIIIGKNLLSTLLEKIAK